jgi:hypothetical protein
VRIALLVSTGQWMIEPIPCRLALAPVFCVLVNVVDADSLCAIVFLCPPCSVLRCSTKRHAASALSVLRAARPSRIVRLANSVKRPRWRRTARLDVTVRARDSPPLPNARSVRMARAEWRRVRQPKLLDAVHARSDRTASLESRQPVPTERIVRRARAQSIRLARKDPTVLRPARAWTVLRAAGVRVLDCNGPVIALHVQRANSARRAVHRASPLAAPTVHWARGAARSRSPTSTHAPVVISAASVWLLVKARMLQDAGTVRPAFTAWALRHQ